MWSLLRNKMKGISRMKDNIRRALLSAAALALIIGPGLPSCSKPAEENAAEQNAVEPVATEPAGTEQAAAGQDATAQNAKGLLKAMSDYLAAQKSSASSDRRRRMTSLV
jgi:hypothetical protein